jgi:hypothetical protein
LTRDILRQGHTRDLLRQGHAHIYVAFRISGSIQASSMILVSIVTNFGVKEIRKIKINIVTLTSGFLLQGHASLLHDFLSSTSERDLDVEGYASRPRCRF